MPIRAQGRWIQLAAPLADLYEALSAGEKRTFLRDWSAKLGESENTLWRAMAGYRYLRGCGLDPLNMDPPPALLAVEAVQRTGKYDRDAERELVDDLQRRYVVRHFLERHKAVRAAALERAAMEAQAKAVHALHQPRRRTFARPLLLSELLMAIARGKPGPFRVIASTRPLLEPNYVVDVGSGLLIAVIVAAYHGGASDPVLFQVLVDRLVLRALSHFDEVHVCTEVDLSDVQESRSGMRAAAAQRLTVVDARIIIDLEIEGMSEAYQDMKDLIRAHLRSAPPGAGES